MKRLIWLWVFGSILLWAIPSGFAATVTQVDKLLDKLVEKKILTEEEAAQLKGEIAYDEKSLREDNMKKDIPQWVQDMKLSGDFRLRYQYERRNSADANEKDRSRGRIRM